MSERNLGRLDEREVWLRVLVDELAWTSRAAAPIEDRVARVRAVCGVVERALGPDWWRCKLPLPGGGGSLSQQEEIESVVEYAESVLRRVKRALV